MPSHSLVAFGCSTLVTCMPPTTCVPPSPVLARDDACKLAELYANITRAHTNMGADSDFQAPGHDLPPRARSMAGRGYSVVGDDVGRKSPRPAQGLGTREGEALRAEERGRNHERRDERRACGLSPLWARAPALGCARVELLESGKVCRGPKKILGSSPFWGALLANSERVPGANLAQDKKRQRPEMSLVPHLRGDSQTSFIRTPPKKGG